jgi:hypothetical protein
MTGTKSGKLFQVDPHADTRIGHVLLSGAQRTLSIDESKRWHQRLTHLYPAVLKSLIDGYVYDGMVCEVCILAKYQRKIIRIPVQRMMTPFELVHSDACGPFTSGKIKIASRASGCTRCSRRSGRNLLNSDATCHGALHLDGASQCTVRPDAAVKATASRRRCHGTTRPDAGAKATPSRRNCHGTRRHDAAVRATASRRRCHGTMRPDVGARRLRPDATATATGVQTQLSRRLRADAPITAPPVQTQVSRRLRPDATVTAPGVQMKMSRRVRPDATVMASGIQT